METTTNKKCMHQFLCCVALGLALPAFVGKASFARARTESGRMTEENMIRKYASHASEQHKDEDATADDDDSDANNIDSSVSDGSDEDDDKANLGDTMDMPNKVELVEDTFKNMVNGTSTEAPKAAASKDLQDKSGRTALMVAIDAQKAIEELRPLIEKTNLNLEDKNGLKALDHAYNVRTKILYEDAHASTSAIDATIVELIAKQKERDLKFATNLAQAMELENLVDSNVDIQSCICAIADKTDRQRKIDFLMKQDKTLSFDCKD